MKEYNPDRQLQDMPRIFQELDASFTILHEGKHLVIPLHLVSERMEAFQRARSMVKQNLEYLENQSKISDLHRLVEMVPSRSQMEDLDSISGPIEELLEEIREREIEPGNSQDTTDLQQKIEDGLEAMCSLSHLVRCWRLETARRKESSLLKTEG